MSEILADTGRLRVRLEADLDCPNPRLDAEVYAGALTVPGGRYLAVAEGGELAEAARDRLFGRGDWGFRHDTGRAVDIFTRWIRLFHGGVTRDEWIHRDGPRVIWYITPEMAARTGLEPTPENMARIVADEAAEYQAWAAGECYGYVVEQLVTYVALEDLTLPEDERRLTGRWEELDSCWGVIGSEWAETAARDAFAAHLPVPA